MSPHHDAEPEVLSNLGHNRPPSMRDEALDQQAAMLAGYEKRRDEFIAAARAGVVRDRDTAGQAADVIRLARLVREEIDSKARELRRPFRETADALKQRVDDFWADAEAAITELSARAEAWQRDERKRIEEQRQEQAALLGDLNAPAAPAPKPRKVRGDYGGQIVDRDVIDYAVEDVRALPVEVLSAVPVTQAIIGVVKRMAAAGLAVPPGIRATPIAKTEIR